ncbi:MAG TPA: PP2C family protein-serine/threonine phosphatase [Leptospiraceae bacterium]|nr:PP2C family protein-serine/threonine phosphatase [Leptospiraceae bacterium]HMX30592.1 PP2C family protein-serine/threonine phosphatase [Leptospiraceae bacterium]HMY31292.1 PP2C family protein-serine/threonine phosphatase [Leptospiraceae bacterium]HMZ63405.1 PP2C family protein-serine/threonine phosphatase [Leptospiraceae bacterium]HNA09227.1 PP2C family protein-serine/threonine phosphatase [Leptospiraceae bacterium]
MKNSLIITIASICFITFNLFILRGIGLGSNYPKRFLYFYPNGYIANTDFDNTHMLGINIEEERIPKIRLEKNKESDFTSEFFLQYKTLTDFSPHIILSLILLITSFWFLIKYSDVYISLLFFDLSIFVYSNFTVLAFDSYYFLFYLSFVFMVFLTIHLGFRLKGKEVSIRWIIPEICASAIVAFTAISQKENSQFFNEFVKLCGNLVCIGAAGCLTVLIYDTIKYKITGNPLIKKIAVIISILQMVIIPYSVFEFNLFRVFNNLHYSLYITFLSFPLLFVYGTYRYTMIREQVYFVSSVVIFTLLSSLIVFYILLMGAVNYLLETFAIQNLEAINVLFLIISTYSLVLAKNKIRDFTEYWHFKRNEKLTQTLEQMIDLVRSQQPMRITTTKLVKAITETLDIQKVVILIPSDLIPDEIKNENILRIHSKSEVWSFFSKEKDITVTTSVMYGSGIRNNVYTFLRQLNIQLAFPMLGRDEKESVVGLILIGQKNIPGNFTLGELTFIKECAKLAYLLLNNYKLLLADIEKKKMERKLKEAMILEETIHPPMSSKINNRQMEIKFFSDPAVSISGDYVDFIPINEKQVFIMLGDVSGHGLGSGYLVSAIKAIVHDQIESGVDLGKLFKNINNFLIERYSGTEFMTLIGGLYDSGSGRFEFINAGHLSPLILRATGEIEAKKSGHRILGVTVGPFTTDSIQLNVNDKLIIYSDGVTETFNPLDEIYGEERLRRFLAANKDMPSENLLEFLKRELENFRKDLEISDDTSFIILKRM